MNNCVVVVAETPRLLCANAWRVKSISLFFLHGNMHASGILFVYMHAYAFWEARASHHHSSLCKSVLKQMLRPTRMASLRITTHSSPDSRLVISSIIDSIWKVCKRTNKHSHYRLSHLAKESQTRAVRVLLAT